MATVPTTLVIYTEDKVNFPLKTALIVMKQLFQYGVKEMSLRENKIFISLSYSPKALTLKRKFGNLPIRYMRLKLEDKNEFKELEKVVKRYQFNLLDEEEEVVNQIQSSTKRKLYLEPPTIIDDDTDSDSNAKNEEVQKNKKRVDESSTSNANDILTQALLDI